MNISPKTFSYNKRLAIVAAVELAFYNLLSRLSYACYNRVCWLTIHNEHKDQIDTRHWWSTQWSLCPSGHDELSSQLEQEQWPNVKRCRLIEELSVERRRAVEQPSGRMTMCNTDAIQNVTDPIPVFRVRLMCGWIAKRASSSCCYHRRIGFILYGFFCFLFALCCPYKFIGARLPVDCIVIGTCY